MTTTDSQLLIRHVESGDRDALDELFGRHYAAVHRVIRQLVRDHFAADDLAQATFVAAIRAGRTAPPRGPLRPWLLAIAIQQVRQHRRSETRRPVDWLRDEYVAADPGRSVDEIASQREFERALESAIERLEPRLAEPLVLHYFEDLPLAGVAQVLALQKSTVQSRIAKAVEGLRAEFRRSGRAALLPMLELRFGALAPGVGWSAQLLRFVPSRQVIAGISAMLAVTFVAMGVWQGGPQSTDSVASREAVAPAPLTPDVEPRESSGASDEMLRDVVVDRSPAVFGRALDAASGAPLVDARLALFDYGSAEVWTTVSGADGSYEFVESRGAVGVFHLVIECAGHGRYVAPEVRAAITPRRDLLAAGSSIRGQVIVAPEGMPVRRYRLRAMRLPFQNPDEWEALTALFRQAIPAAMQIDRTLEVDDPRGAFVLEDLAAGLYVLIVEAPDRPPVLFNGGGQPWERFRGVEAGTREPIEIILGSQGSAEVEVLDAQTALPVPDARVTYTIGFDRTRIFGDEVAADGTGRFTLPVHFDADGRIVTVDALLTAPGYASRSVELGARLGGHRASDVTTWTMDRAASVRGTVRDRAGRSVPGAILLVERGHDEVMTGCARADALGHYRIGDLDAEAVLSLRCLTPTLDAVIGTVALRLTPGQESLVDFDARSRAGVFGSVRRRGVPMRDAALRLEGEDGGRAMYCSTGIDGGFSFDGVLPGRYELYVSAADPLGVLRARRIVEIPAGGSLQRDFEFGQSIRGVIVDSMTGAPIAREFDFECSARNPDGTIECFGDVGADGRFTIDVVGPGSYELALHRSDHWMATVPTRVEVPIEGGDAAASLRVVPRTPNGRIELRIVDAATHAPVDEGFCSYSDSRSSTGATFEAGLFVAEALPLGAYEFKIGSDRHATARFEADVTSWQPAFERTVALEPSRSVTITSVSPGSAAHRVGLRVGDVLRRYAGVEVPSIAALRHAIAGAEGSVEIAVEREGLGFTFRVAAGPLGIGLRNGD